MKKLLYLLVLLIFISGCEKDDDVTVLEPIKEVEIINENNFTKLTEGTVIVDITEDINSVTANQIVINTTTEKIHNLQIGQFFVSGKSQNAPNGFAREITDISKEGDVITFQIKQARFDEIYEEVSIDVKAEIDYDNFIPVNKSKSLKSTQRPISVSYSDDLQAFEINTVLYDDDGNYETTNDQLIWDGTFEIEENNSIFIFSSVPFTPKIFNLSMYLKLKAVNTLSNTQEFDISSEPFELAKVPLTLGLPTSIAVNAFLVLRMGADGNITAAVSVSNETNITAFSTINYDNANDQWQLIQASPPVSITTENSFNGSIELSVSPYIGVGLTLAFTSYDTANAGIFLDSNLRFNANVNTELPQINWDYGYFFELNAEANVNVMGTFMDVDYDSTLWDSDYIQLGQGTYYLSSLENISPLDNEVLNTSPIVFEWSSTISEPVTYEVFMGTSETNLDVVGTSSSLTYTLTDTPANGTYFWKVFAKNNDDVIISKSSIFSFEFNDSPSVLTLTTNSITGITQNSATSGGNVTDDGGNAVTVKGICYSTTPNPTTADITSNDGTGTGVFTSNMTGLTANTTYYVKAYATNSEGTAYGNEISFTTLNSSSTTEPAYNPIPNDNSTNISLNGNLSFTEGNNTPTDATFKVYFDTNSNPNTVFNLDANVNTLNYSNLQEATPYYWKVQTISSSNDILAESPIWSFTTTDSSITVTDIDGNVYQTVQIGNQVWMAENLKVTQYSDGTPLTLVTSDTDWGNQLNDNTNTSFCWYNDDVSNKNIYGALYTFGAVIRGDVSDNNVQGICPVGWHVPSSAEKAELGNYLNANYGVNFTGGSLKQVGTTLWQPPNENATNETEFNALPSGGRNGSNGTFFNLGISASFHISRELNTQNSQKFFVRTDSGQLGNSNSPKNGGSSCRCIEN
ncbi:FISUMP domain-containing protein [Psychroflexus torquis]|nr:FISUMP domain-containing protein [Psychroflexus torquis]